MDWLDYCTGIYAGVHLTLAVILFLLRPRLLYAEKWLWMFAIAMVIISIQLVSASTKRYNLQVP